MDSYKEYMNQQWWGRGKSHGVDFCRLTLADLNFPLGFLDGFHLEEADNVTLSCMIFFPGEEDHKGERKKKCLNE